MHGGIDEKRKNSPCVGGEGKRAVNKGSMNEKESASISEANNRGFHESCPRVIPSFRIFRLAKLRPKTGISFFFFKSNVSELEYISTRRKNSSISSLSLSLSAHPVSPCSSARNHETTTDIDTWPHAPGTTLQIRRSLLYRAIDHRRAIVRSSLSDGEGCTLGFIERGAGGRVTHLYSTFGGFASARHLKRSSLPSTMRPFLPNPDRILRDTFGA